MEENSVCKKDKKIYLQYTILFAVISLAVFAIFIKLNKGFIWERDGFKQHYIILYDFNQMMRSLFQNGFSTFSWNMGLGLDVIGQYSYYVLGDPFAYISLLFPIERLETIYSVLVILRMYCVGLAFIMYCRYQGKNKGNTLIGTIIYTFGGFVLWAGIRHPYFTNAAILLPLTFIGIDKLLKENKKVYLILITMLAMVNNYYFFYMIAIIDVIYAVVKYMVEYNEGIKVFFKKAGTAMLCYLIGILMASIILLPTIYAFLNSARTGYEQTYLYGSGAYKNFYMGLICMRHSHWTIIGLSSIILLMIPILFTKRKEKEAKTFWILLVITTIMLIVPVVSSIMNGFSFPNNRWIFAYSFILSYIVTICFNQKLDYSKKQIKIMTIFVAIYCLIGMCITKLRVITYLDFYASMGFCVLMWLVIVLSNTKQKKLTILLKYNEIFMILLIICNIWTTSYGLYHGNKKNSGYAKEFLNNHSVIQKSNTLKGKMKHFKEAIDYIKENDKEFYRIAKCDGTNQNLSLLYDYHGIQSFLSIGNGSIYDFTRSLEDINHLSTLCINGVDRRTQAMTMLGTKYYICHKKAVAYVPYGYELYKEIGDTQIYKNKYHVSMGMFYDNYLLKEEYNKLSPLQREQVLLTSAVIEEENHLVEKQENIEKYVDNIVRLDYQEKGNKIQNNQINVKDNNEEVTLIVDDIKPNTEIYLSIKNLKYTSKRKKKDFQIKASFQGVSNSENVLDKLSSAYYVDDSDILMNLGVVKERGNHELKITFNNKGKYSFDNLEILAVPMGQYEEKVSKIRKNEMKNILYDNQFVKGELNNQKNGILQISTSYSDGWRAFIDGKETEVIKVNKGFIGIVVEAGKHEIEFRYETPYLKLGIVLSIIGTIALIGVIIFEKTNLKNRLFKVTK